MNNHKFRVGQIVGFSSPPRQDAPMLTRDFKVLQLLRHSSGECAYRVKTITEAFARIAAKVIAAGRRVATSEINLAIELLVAEAKRGV